MKTLKSLYYRFVAYIEIMGYARAASALAQRGMYAEAKSLILQSAKARQTAKELSALSDAELRDIGISRGDIWSIANGRTDDLRSA